LARSPAARCPILAVVCACVLSSCAAAPPPAGPPLLPRAAAWKTLLGDFVAPPLATDGRRVFVATRDGVVRALAPATGEIEWQSEGHAGQLSAAEGSLLVRHPDGTLTSLHPRTGAVRWRAQTGVKGVLPAFLDADRAWIGGEGLAAVDLAGGRVLWSDRSASVSAPPVRAGGRLLVGEQDGTLRCRDRETGASLWTLPTRGALLAPPLVDAARGRAYLGTTDKRILEIDLDDGRTGWRWLVGADVAHAGLLLPRQVLFASFDAVLWALRPDGRLAWRGSLPSRPLSSPLLVGDQLLVACLENELVAFSAATGERSGAMRTSAEIRTAPLVVGTVLVLGLRDRSVLAYGLPGYEPPAPQAPEVAAPAAGR
jgi:outer membrane protein assembly factor BamB